MAALFPGISVNALQSAFLKAGERIACLECIVMLQNRVQEIVQEWSQVKVRHNDPDDTACLALTAILWPEDHMTAYDLRSI